MYQSVSNLSLPIPDIELRVINETTGKEYQSLTVNGKGVIGVSQRHAFSICLKNKSYQNVQIRLVMDGVDVLTGEKATTSPQGETWLVPANSEIVVKAWPETNSNGRQFVFSDLKNSVAKSTIDDFSKVGLIEAHVFVDNVNYNNIYGSGWQIFNAAHNGENIYGSFTYDSHQGYATASIGDIPAVGAGETIDQKITKVAGLQNPTFYKTIACKYINEAEFTAFKNAIESKPVVEEKRLDLKDVPVTTATV